MSNSTTIDYFVDFGNYTIQAMSSVGGSQPLIIRSATQMLGRTRVLRHDQTNPIIVWDDKRYHIGDAALKYPGAMKEVTVESDKSNPDLVRLFLLGVLEPLGDALAYTVRLHFTVPDPYRLVGVNETVGERLARALTGTYDFIRNGVQMQVHVKALAPEYEGLAPVLVARKGGLIANHGYTICIDIGGGTTNVLVVDGDGEVLDQRTLDGCGGIALARAICADTVVQARCRHGLQVWDVMDATARGLTHVIGNPSASWSDVFVPIRDKWLHNILSRVMSGFGQYFAKTTNILFIGGNANLLTKDQNKLFVVYPNPETANVTALMELHQNG